MVCDFDNIRLYRQTTGQVWNLKTAQLHKHVKLFSTYCRVKVIVNLPEGMRVDRKAAEKMGEITRCSKN
jgi:hypothetical protein